MLFRLEMGKVGGGWLCVKDIEARVVGGFSFRFLGALFFAGEGEDTFDESGHF